MWSLCRRDGTIEFDEEWPESDEPGYPTFPLTPDWHFACSSAFDHATAENDAAAIRNSQAHDPAIASLPDWDVTRSAQRLKSLNITLTPTVTPKRKIGEEGSPMPPVYTLGWFSFSLPDAKSNEDGSASPSSKVGHYFHKLALRGSGGVVVAHIQSANSSQQRQGPYDYIPRQLRPILRRRCCLPRLMCLRFFVRHFAELAVGITQLVHLPDERLAP